MKKILIFSIIFLLLINLISFVSADKMSGSFTITGEAVEESNDEGDSFLNSIKDFFIYAFTLGGEFEIKDPETPSGEPSTIKASTGDVTTEPTGSEDKSKEDEEDYNQTNQTIGEETSKETETPLKLKQSETIFIIVMILILIVLFLLKRKIAKFFRGKARRRKK